MVLAGLGLAVGGAVGAVADTATAAAVDVDAPRGAVGGLTSPASGTMVLHVRATDEGLGLAGAQASVDGVVVASAALGGASVEDAQLPIATPTFGDGTHQLQVRVTDAAGNGAVLLDQTFVINNTPPDRQTSALLTLGTGGASVPPGGSGPTGSGPVGGAGSGGSATSGGGPVCRAPRLSMFLKDKPPKVVKGVPVLRRNGRYRYGGTLTCAVDGRRVHAPSGVVISLVDRIGRRTSRRNGVATRADGGVSVILACASSRLLEFRYTSIDGSTTRVRIRVAVAATKSKNKAAR